jgi:uncharacterized protein (TIGR02466 family)
MKILELFPTPVAAIKLPEELGTIVNWFYQQEMLGEESVQANDYGERSKNSYILNEQPCTNLKNFILDKIKEYGNKLGYDYEEYKLTQSWLSYKYPNQHHTMHSHPNSLISGVLYFGESNEKTPAIKFHKPILGVNVSYLSPKRVRNKEFQKFSQGSFQVDFEPGLLLLFPSYLLHSVPINTTNSIRCSLAFNCVPGKSLGEETELTEFLF